MSDKVDIFNCDLQQHISLSFRRRPIMNHVREFRKNLGLSQLELAKSIGVSRQTINMIENNKYNPTLELCLNLAKALDTDLNSLFWDENPNRDIR